MSHHSQDGPLGTGLKKLIQSEEKQKLIEEFRRKELGPTGEFPDGKMVPWDEGEIKFAVGGHSGKVTIDFGKPVHAIGMTPQQAMSLAQLLIRQARDANIIGASKEPLTLEIG